jgi:DNA-binding protein Alba
MANATTIFIRNRRDKHKMIKDAIFAFSGGRKSILIKGEGEEISTAVEIAEILKNRLYPGIEIENVSLGSRPFYERKQRGYNNRNKSNQNKKDIISKIEILLKTKSYM